MSTDQKKIQVEDIIDILHLNYKTYTGSNEAELHAAEDIIELFESKSVSPVDPQSEVLSAEYVLDNHLKLMLGRTSESYVSIDEMKKQPEYSATIDAMEPFANLRVEQEKDKIKLELFESLLESFKGVHSDYHYEIVETAIQDLKHGI